MNDETKIQKIKELNDQCRSFAGIPVFNPPFAFKVLVTRGVQALSPEDQISVIAKVRDFDDFSEANDPYGEHDFGSFEHHGQKIFWKIDYYDASLHYGSEDPSDPDKTCRVLTVMLAEEY